MADALSIFLIETAVISFIGVLFALLIKRLRGRRMSNLSALGTAFALMFGVSLILNMIFYASIPNHRPNTVAGVLIFLTSFWILGFGTSRAHDEKRDRLVSGLNAIANNSEESPERRAWAEERLKQFSESAKNI